MIVATRGSQKALLEAEFPSISFVDLPGYDIQFDKNRAFTVFRLMASIPKILIRIKREKAWLRRFSEREKPDMVISDNRYGLSLEGIYCVFITHQLLIKTPFGPRVDRLLQMLNYRLIGRFSSCWIPDIAATGGLAGELSHPAAMPSIPHRYIGLLSRFGAEAAMPVSAATGAMALKADGYLLALLSGPEPQRTLLEKIILEQAAGCPLPIVLVRGLPGGGNTSPTTPPGMIIHDHLPAGALGRVIRDAALVLARPGYSTLMDLVRLKKSAVLVPTPGQSEQEYLGKRVAAKGWAICMKQRDLSLAGVLAAVRAIPKWPAEEDGTGRLAVAITELLCCC